MRSRVVVAFALLYSIWGSTYLAIRFALEGFPPLFLSGVRFVAAGLALYLFLRLRGARNPSWTQWRASALIGVLLVFGNAGVVIAEQWVSSGVAAVAVASSPLWIALFAGLFGAWPVRSEWIGLGIGLGGVAVLQTGEEMRASPLGAAVLMGACVSWALGSVWSRRLPLPEGPMSSAAQMLTGGSTVLLLSFVRGERMTQVPGPKAWAALAYLTLFGSLVAYSAYQYVLREVRPALASSYAYVNPIVAVGLGVLFAGEAVAPGAVFALLLILGGVALLALARTAVPTSAASARD